MTDSKPPLHRRHVVPSWPPPDAVREVAEALPGTSSWVALAGAVPAVTAERERVYALRAAAWTPLAVIRRRYRRALADQPPAAVVLYHHDWGTDLLSAEDGAARRLFWGHAPASRTRAGVDRLARSVDALWFDRESWRAAVAQTHSWIPARRLRHLPAAFVRQQARFPAPPPAERPEAVVFGWVGAFELATHRADRLPRLLAELGERGFRGRIELCGEGRLERALRRSLPDRLEVDFFPRTAWLERMPAWTGVFDLGNNAAWTAPVAEALRGGRQLFIPVEAEENDLPPPIGYPAGDLTTLAERMATAHRGGSAATSAARRLLARAGRAGSAEQLASELSTVAELPIRRRHDTAPAGLWPFAVYRRMHRLLGAVPLPG